MVRSMIAGVAGLKSHQSKLDVIGNNIANVNTWGFKSYSYHFQDAMYVNSINSAGGSQLAGAAGGRNASQVGYGSAMSSISTEFNTGAPSPSSNNMDCMIDGTGFFLVGNMVNGTFNNIEGSGLYLSRVGIFRVDNNGYLVDNQGSYVYGYAPLEGTGTPEVPATSASVTLKDLPVTLTPPDQVKDLPGYVKGTAATAQVAAVPTKVGAWEVPDGKWAITIAGITVPTNVTSKNDFEDAVNDWITAITKEKATDATGQNNPKLEGNIPTRTATGDTYKYDAGTTKTFLDFTKVNLSLDRIGRYLNSATITVTAKEAGDITTNVTANDNFKNIESHLKGIGFVVDPNNKKPATDKTGELTTTQTAYNKGNDLVPGIAAEYADQLSTIRIPVDPQTGLRYDIQGWAMDKYGCILGTDINNRTVPIGQLALVTVENPAGLEKKTGYYYNVGANAGDVEAIKPNGGPTGVIKSGYLEMANVDLANEFSSMITTQRGFQANSKIITVTDEMLQEIVNLKR